MNNATLITLGDEHVRFLEQAAAYLEHPSWMMRVANMVGKPTEALVHALPGPAKKLVDYSTHKALRVALDWAVRTIPAKQNAMPLRKGRRRHVAMAGLAGAVGGLYGIAGAAVELPITTTIMLRSIARTASEAGFDLHEPATRMECMNVFSLGSPRIGELESTYLMSRVGTSMAVSQAAKFVASRTAQEVADAVSRGTAPLLLRFLDTVASRFSLVVSEKLAAQAVPIAGAAMGVLLNTAFTDHFNRVAYYHFGILRMEQMFGKEIVQARYQEIALKDTKNVDSAASGT